MSYQRQVRRALPKRERITKYENVVASIAISRGEADGGGNFAEWPKPEITVCDFRNPGGHIKDSNIDVFVRMNCPVSRTI